MKPDFQFFEPIFFIAGQSKKKSVFLKKKNCWKIFDHKNNKTEIEDLAS